MHIFGVDLAIDDAQIYNNITSGPRFTIIGLFVFHFKSIKLNGKYNITCKSSILLFPFNLM